MKTTSWQPNILCRYFDSCWVQNFMFFCVKKTLRNVWKTKISLPTFFKFLRPNNVTADGLTTPLYRENSSLYRENPTKVFFSSSNPLIHSSIIKPHSELLNYLISIFLSQQNYIPHSLTTALHTTITNHTIHNTSTYHKFA